MTGPLLTLARLARSRPVAEALEARTVPALVVQLDQGVLGIWGTDGDDVVTVNQVAGRISVVGTSIDSSGKAVTSVPASAVRRIDIVAGAGDDQVFLDSQSVLGHQPILRPTRVWGQNGDDWIIGGEGPDTIDAGSGEDVVHGGGGNDSLWGGGAKVWLYGDTGADVLEAESAQAVLDGGAGNDRLEVWGDSTAWLSGGPGNDRLTGDAGGDQMDGGIGNDSLFGYAGDDVLVGGPGNDNMFGGDGSDDLDGGAGTDILWGGDEAFTETLDDGLDTFHDLFNGNQPVYLGATLSDIRQMGSPSCAFLAAVGGAIRGGWRFGPSFMPVGGNEYAVFLYEAAAGVWVAPHVHFDGTWTDLDANVPRSATGAVLPEFWPVLLQRAYLQDRGIDWSDPAQADAFRTDPADAITALTGWDTETVSMEAARPAALGQTLSLGNAVVATTPDVPAADLYPGIVPDHAYTVLAVTRVGSDWYVQLRNPWGTDFEPTTGWTPQGADDGIISLRWEDFVANFTGIVKSI